MPERMSSKRKWLLRIGIVIPLFALVAVPLYLWAKFGYTYSLGERVGIVQITSDGGWVCKTYRGELAMASEAPVAKIFKFTVRDKDVATQINDLAGQRVVVHYEQHKGVPSTCFGESEYFVTGIRRL